MAKTDRDDREDVNGYLFTHWDCPCCGSVNEVEGMASGEDAECGDCGYKVRIRSAN